MLKFNLFLFKHITLFTDGTYELGGGKICPDGVYTWKITVKKKGVDEIITKTGHVTLVR